MLNTLSDPQPQPAILVSQRLPGTVSKFLGSLQAVEEFRLARLCFVHKIGASVWLTTRLGCRYLGYWILVMIVPWFRLQGFDVA